MGILYYAIQKKSINVPLVHLFVDGTVYHNVCRTDTIALSNKLIVRLNNALEI